MVILTQGNLCKGGAMAIFDRMNKALADHNAEAYLDLYADDAVFVRHQSGTTGATPLQK